ncbi:MAG: tripartite tricarboxylate transporter substrate-binding protein [Spirochaetaceae bacterium]|nr:tripartite tricarboxylate transporter substrate-binding protein [Spirochaetaceae bacterium]
MRKGFMLIASLLAITATVPVFAQAAFAPSQNIEWIVTSSPGGGSDIYTRIISDIMTKMNLVNGKTILVTNKTDGGGEVGRLTVSRVPAGRQADHTLLTFNSGDLMPMVANTANRIENFTPIALMAVDKQLLYIGEQAKYKTFAEVIAAVKAGKNVVIAGSKGDDVATYKLLIKELGFSETQLAFITNNATSDAITSILGGHVDLVMSKPAAADQYVLAGKLTPILALSSTRFTGNLASAPTLSEVGPYKNVEYPVWRGVVGPKSMSPAAVKFWSSVFKAVSESEAWKTGYIEKYKLQPFYMDYEQAREYMTDYQADYLKSIGK